MPLSKEANNTTKKKSKDDPKKDLAPLGRGAPKVMAKKKDDDEEEQETGMERIG